MPSSRLAVPAPTEAAVGAERRGSPTQACRSGALWRADVLATPVDGDSDGRQLENRVTCLGEAQAIADDYIAVPEKLGYSPMPDRWW